MKYRILGRTGLKVSELGVGGHEYRRILNSGQFPGVTSREDYLKGQSARTKLVGRAIDAGVNYFDSTLPEEAESLGMSLKALGKQYEVNIAAEIISPLQRIQEASPADRSKIMAKGIGDRLELLQTERIDIFNVHAPESAYYRELLEIALEGVGQAKREGKVRWVGASCHKPAFLAELIRMYDCFDSVMVPYNYYQCEPKSELFPVAKAREVGVVVMKPFTWPYYGIPFMRFCPVEEREDGLTPAQVSLRWILEAPEVGTIVPGINSEAELDEALGAMDKDGKVRATILEEALGLAQGPEARSRLEAMLEDSSQDIRQYAKRALEAM